MKTIAYAVCIDGTSPASIFISSLDPKQRLRMMKLFQMLGDHGQISNTQKFKKITDTVFFEFKDFQIRMPCFHAPGNLVVITHGFTKKADKIAQQELRLDERIRQEDARLVVAQETLEPEAAPKKVVRWPK